MTRMQTITSIVAPITGSGTSISLAAVSLSNLHIIVSILAGLGSLAVSVATVLWILKQSKALDLRRNTAAPFPRPPQEKRKDPDVA